MFVPRRETVEHIARVDAYVRNWENEVTGRGLFGGVWNTVGASGQPGYQNGATGTLAFLLDTEGFVYLRGTYQIDTNIGVTIFTLPVGYRPAKIGRWRSVLTIVDILDDGRVQEKYSWDTDPAPVDGFAFRIV